MKQNYIAPQIDLPAFNCPNCGVFAVQVWESLMLRGHGVLADLKGAQCQYCKKSSVWRGKKLVFPLISTAPEADNDMPDDVREDFEEARIVASFSPRAAAALLRLGLQKLMRHLGESGKDINADIANLVKKGLLPTVQQALDGVRVIGNNAVHPGQIDLRDDQQTVDILFGLLNFIVEALITHPKQVNSLYSSLPPSAIDGIAKRDGTP